MFNGKRAQVRGVALSANGRLAVSASSDKTLKVWDVATGLELRTLKGHSDWVNSVAVSDEGRLAVSASDDKTLKVWDISADFAAVTGFPVLSKSMVQTGVIASVDDAEVAFAGEPYARRGHTDAVNSVALNADGHLAVSASADGMLKVWDVASGRELHAHRGYSAKGEPMYGVAFSADGSLAVSVTLAQEETPDGRDFKFPRLEVWNIETDELHELRALETHNGTVRCNIALSADGRLAVSASADNTLKVWDVVMGRELRTLARHSDKVMGVALSADGRLAVSASMDKTLKVWDAAMGRELRTLTGHSDEVIDVALSTDGRLAVSASKDKTLKVWDTATGHELLTFSGHSDAVKCVALSANGRLAVSASMDETLKVWNMATGQTISTLSARAYLLCCAITLDGRTIVAGDALGAVHFLELAGVGEILQSVS